MDIIRYRKATMDDAAFLAMVVAEALGNNLMERMAMGEDTLQDRELIQQLFLKFIDFLIERIHLFFKFFTLLFIKNNSTIISNTFIF